MTASPPTSGLAGELDAHRSPMIQTDAPYIDLLIERLLQAGRSAVLRYNGQDVTAVDFAATIFRYARALAHTGIGRGGFVALFAPNSPDALAIRYATNLLGAAAAFLPLPSDAQRRQELIAQMDPGLLVLFPETAWLLRDTSTVRVAAVGLDLLGVSLRLDTIAAGQQSDRLESLARPEDFAVVVGSGGTTGISKGSWRDFARYTAMVQTRGSAGRRQLINGRLAYLSQVLVDITLLGGGVVILEGAFNAAATLATIEAERITDLFLVEPQLFEVMDHPDVARRDLSSLRTITHIGASAPPTLRRRARERLGAVLAHTYGASEIGLVSTLSPAEHDLGRPASFTCAGRPLPGIEIRFRRNDGALAGPGESGIVEVRSRAMARGYRNRPVLQAAAFVGGWYRTGDLGLLDPDGYLHIFGRATDITWINAQMVSPTLLEDTLCQLPDVRYAVVVADREACSWIAAVVPWPGSSVELERCRTVVAAGHGVTSLAILALDRVTLTEQGKPDRAVILRLGREAGAVTRHSVL